MATDQLKNVRCPWCRQPFDIDPAMAAFPYWCPDCGEISTIGALRHPNFDANAAYLSFGFTTAVTPNVYRHTLAYVSGKSQIASGTLVTLGNRCLIATTAHSLPNQPNELDCVQKITPEFVERPPLVLKLEKARGIDVGLIEVESDAPQLLRMDALTIDRIADLESGRHGCRAWLIGFPRKQLVPHYRQHGILGFRALSTSCEPIEPAAWSKVDVGKIDDVPGKLCPDTHVLIHYCTTEPVYNGVDDSMVAEIAPEPYGMSGGGLWQSRQPTADTSIWSAESVCLFAIQSSWPKRGEHLKAIQVIHWLRLVADTYPDVRQELQQHFPRL